MFIGLVVILFALGVFVSEVTGFVLSADGHCPDAWKYLLTKHGGRCYYMIKAGYNWDLANYECQRLAGHLVSIHSQAEQDFLQNYTISEIDHNSMFWIGLSDRGVEGKYTWLADPYQMEYTNWHSGEPDDTSSDCGMLYHGEWWDQHCTATRSSLCEMHSI